MDYHDRSTQAMVFNLFFPFLDETTGRVDSRLLQALGVPADVPYTGCFDKVLDEAENTRFDFYLEGAGERKIFFLLKLDEPEFDSCENDAEHDGKLERHYRPYLTDRVDAPWLESETFCKHFEILRHVSYLGRYPASGLVFIYPKANESLAEPENAIKRIVSKSLAPRVAILHLEYLVARILTLAQGNVALHAHFLQFKEKYVVPQTA